MDTDLCLSVIYLCLSVASNKKGRASLIRKTYRSESASIRFKSVSISLLTPILNRIRYYCSRFKAFVNLIIYYYADVYLGLQV